MSQSGGSRECVVGFGERLSSPEAAMNDVREEQHAECKTYVRETFHDLGLERVHRWREGSVDVSIEEEGEEARSLGGRRGSATEHDCTRHTRIISTSG